MAIELVRTMIVKGLIWFGPLFFILLTLFLGRYPLSMKEVLFTFYYSLFPSSVDVPAIHETVVMHIRMPRAILGAAVGGCLAVSGAAFQSLFRNPLVSSGILGVSSGAGFGAALGIVFFNSALITHFMAFGFGLTAVGLSYLVGRIYKTTPTIMLILGGVIVSSIFSALLSLMKYVADTQNHLPDIVFWLMGSLALARYKDILYAGIPMMVGVVGLFLIRWQLNLLSMGDKEARTLGVRLYLVKGITILFASLATAGAVCATGTIGWVGLVIPHIGRMLMGNNNKILIPVSFSLGASFLLLVDNVARNLTGAEIPLGILTALLGGPFFIYLLKKTKARGW